MLYQISYELHGESWHFDKPNAHGFDYNQFYQTLEKDLEGRHILRDVWWVKTDMQVIELYEFLKPLLYEKDNFIISELDTTKINGYIPQSFWPWLFKNDKPYKHINLYDHPKNEENVFKDLVKKWHQFRTLYIGVDFDNTLLPYGSEKLVNEDGTSVDDGFIKVVELLRRAKELGLQLCLWTLPTSQENLEWKIKWCEKNGISMDYVNSSPLLKELNKDFKKVHFNLLLDDVAGLEAAYSILYNLCVYIEENKSETD